MGAPDDGVAPGTPARTRWRRAAPWLSGVLLLAVVVAVVLHAAELEEFLKLAREARPAWLLAALALQAGTYLATAAVWFVGMRRAGLPTRLRALVPLSLAKLFVDQVFPTGGVSGNAVVLGGLVRRGIPAPVAMAGVLGGLLGYYASYLALVVAAMLVLRLHHLVHPALVLAAVPFAVVAAGAPLAILWIRHREDSPVRGLLGRIPGIRSLADLVARAPGAVLRDPMLIGGAFVLEAAVFLLDAATLWVCLLALGIRVGFLTAFPAFMVASMVATLGPIPLGLGTFEAAAVGILGLLGVPLAAALTATLLLRGFTFWLPMAPGSYLARREVRGGTGTPPARGGGMVP